MEIIVAKTAGFCMGVQRAVEIAMDAPGNYKTPVYTFGPLIHNPLVLDLLKEKGITAISDIPNKGSGTVIIRAHGVTPDIIWKLKSAGFTVIDATCPRVVKVQSIIDKYAHKGYASIIVGDRDHPEVIGLLGYTKENGYVVSGLKDLKKLPPFDKAIIVAQTTQDANFYSDVKKWASNLYPNYIFFDTICDSTQKRQAEVKDLAESVEAVIVIGGRNSGNTQRLADIAGRSEKPVFHIETESELNFYDLKSYKTIGVTTGASTPDWLIERVCKALASIS